MNETDALRDMLHDLTRLYCGERVEVRFDTQPHYAGEDFGGPYLAVNADVNDWYDIDPPVSGPNELRLLRDTLSHESYEFNMGKPNAKAAFIVRHGEVEQDDDETVQDAARRAAAKGRYAGQIYNVIRDAWVNSARCANFPGLRRTFAYKADLLAGDADVSELPTHEALLAGLHQIALTNTANGISNADSEVREALAWARLQVEDARAVDSHVSLLAIADRVADRFVAHVPAGQNARDDDLLQLIDDRTMKVETDDMDASAVSSTLNLADPPEDIADDLDLNDMAVDMTSADDVDAADDGDGSESSDGPSPEDLPDSLADAEGDSEDADGSGAGGGAESPDDGNESGAGGSGGDEPTDEGEPGPTSESDENGESGSSGDAGGSESDHTDQGEDGESGEPDRVGDGVTSGDSGRFDGDSSTVLDDMLDDMDDLEGSERPAGDRLGLDDGDDYHDPDAGDRDRFEQIQKHQNRKQTPMGDRIGRRNEWGNFHRKDVDADEIKSLMRERGLVKQFRTAFSRIKTAERTTTTRKPTQSINLKNAVRHKAGDFSTRDVYETTERGATGGRAVCVVNDGSRSMNKAGSFHENNAAIVDEKATFAALALAADEIGDTIMGNVFDSKRKNGVGLVTAPDEPFSWEHLDEFSCTGGCTPLASGIMDGIELLDEVPNPNDRVMLVLTDGKANEGLTGTKWARHATGDNKADAAKAAEFARAEGITVIGVGIGSAVNERYLRHIFGTDDNGEDLFVHVDADTLVDDVLRIYREQLDDDRVADVHL